MPPRSNRPFKFMHLYSGPNNPLAIQMEAKQNRWETVILSLDNKLGPNLDLFVIMKEDVGKGEWDYIHSGSFSMARHHNILGQPGPVREKANIYGLPGNTEVQQREADRETRMATQSAEVQKEQIKSYIARKVPRMASLENPPGNAISGGAWDVSEVDACLNAPRARSTTITPAPSSRSRRADFRAWRRSRRCACARSGWYMKRS